MPLIPLDVSTYQEPRALWRDSPIFSRDSKQTVFLMIQTILLAFDVWFHQVLLKLEEYLKPRQQFNITSS